MSRRGGSGEVGSSRLSRLFQSSAASTGSEEAPLVLADAAADDLEAGGQRAEALEAAPEARWPAPSARVHIGSGWSMTPIMVASTSRDPSRSPNRPPVTAPAAAPSTEAHDGHTAADALERESGGLAGLTRWLEQNVPFLVLLALVFVYEHWEGARTRDGERAIDEPYRAHVGGSIRALAPSAPREPPRAGILTVLWLTAGLNSVNTRMREQVALKDKRNTAQLVMLLLLVLSVVAATLTVFHEERLWLQLCFLVPERPGGAQPSFLTLVWKVIVTDLMARFLSIACKICVALCLCGTPHRRLRQVYRLLEIVVVVYRSVLPGPQWYCWLLAANGSSHLFSSLVTGLYLTFKLAAVMDQLKTAAAICRSTVLKHSVRAGPTPASTQTRERSARVRRAGLEVSHALRLRARPSPSLLRPYRPSSPRARSSTADTRQRRRWPRAPRRRAQSATTTSAARSYSAASTSSARSACASGSSASAPARSAARSCAADRAFRVTAARLSCVSFSEVSGR